MVHDNVSLTVSQAEARKVEDEAKRRLLTSKKLSLVVDLDQTIIHATVDPTVAEWQKDEKNPNHAAVKDVRVFQLVDDGRGARGCSYYIKLRPGLEDFLANVSQIYELHIYTMGTRAYAQNIANIIDPERKIFGDRILSRDESGSLVAKNLQRLFPVDTKMVVIIDDRGDVWNWNENLIKVTPYDFFVGIGDINSSFLPKKPEANLTPKAEVTESPEPMEASSDIADQKAYNVKLKGNNHESLEDRSSISSTSSASSISTLEQLVSMGGGDDPLTLQAQTSRQEETLAAQLQDRPLLQKQKQLEAEDAASESSGEKDKVDDSSGLFDAHSDSESRHRLLQDNDEELFHLERSLRRVHTLYFETYERQLANVQGGRIAELRGSQKKKQILNNNHDLAIVPDVKLIMPQTKRRVLEGVVLVLSGIIPLHLDWRSSDITLWAQNFGARVEKDVGRRTTHVVAARNRTAKVRQAAKRGKSKIKVVSPAWLTDSIIRWSKLEEEPYLLNIEEGDAGSVKGGIDDNEEALSMSEDIASGVDSEEDYGSSKTKGKALLTIKTHDTDEESDIEGVLPSGLEDEHSPVGGTNEDWSQMHDELAEFLGSEAEDSDDDDSMASLEIPVSVQGKKRSHDDSGDESDGDIPTNKGRKKQALGRVSNLNQASLAGLKVSGNGESGLPTPDITAGEEGDGEAEEAEDGDGDVEEDEFKRPDQAPEPTEEGDGWSDFEDDLEAELKKAAGEVDGEG